MSKKDPKFHFIGSGLPSGEKRISRFGWHSKRDDQLTACGLPIDGTMFPDGGCVIVTSSGTVTRYVTSDPKKVTCGSCLRNRKVAEAHSIWPDAPLRSNSFEVTKNPRDKKRGLVVSFVEMDHEEMLVVMDTIMDRLGKWLLDPGNPILPKKD